MHICIWRVILDPDSCMVAPPVYPTQTNQGACLLAKPSQTHLRFKLCYSSARAFSTGFAENSFEEDRFEDIQALQILSTKMYIRRNYVDRSWFSFFAYKVAETNVAKNA